MSFSEPTAGPSGGDMAPPPTSNGFRPASSLPRPSAGPSTAGSLRNAANGQEPSPASASSGDGDNAEASGSITTEATAAPAAPVKPVYRPAQSKNAIIFSAVQRRNPVTHAIKNVSTEVGEITADFQVGLHAGVLFLSLKYHRLHPEYIHQRIEKMKNQYNLRILMILCDISEHQQSIRELSKIAIINDYTTFVAWTNEEVAQYLVTFKSFEHKSADSLKERVHQTYPDQLQHVLTSGKKVNKTDAENLAAQFGSFANISRQQSKVLSSVKGLGATKVTSLVDAFHKPFLVGGLKRDGSASTSKGGAIMEKTKIVTPALQNGKGKEKATETSADKGGRVEVVDMRQSSPDWEMPEDEEDDDQLRAMSVPRDRVPSRSPGMSPEPRNGDEGAWRDPLEDDDDADEGPPDPKRARAE